METQPVAATPRPTFLQAFRPLWITAILSASLLGADYYRRSADDAPSAEPHLSAEVPRVSVSDVSDTATAVDVSQIRRNGYPPDAYLATVLDSSARRRQAANPALRAGTGELRVESIPAGATIYLDEKELGRTPLILRNVPSGSHEARLTLSGFEPINCPIKMGDGDHQKMSKLLTRRVERTP